MEPCKMKSVVEPQPLMVIQNCNELFVSSLLICTEIFFKLHVRKKSLLWMLTVPQRRWQNIWVINILETRNHLAVVFHVIMNLFAILMIYLPLETLWMVQIHWTFKKPLYVAGSVKVSDFLKDVNGNSFCLFFKL